MPEQWEVDNPLLKKLVFNTEPSNVIQHPEGKVTIQFSRRSFDHPRMTLEIRSMSSSSRRSLDLPPITIPPSD